MSTITKRDFEKDVVYLFQFPRSPSIPSLSPYCLKLETWLRIADINYQNVDVSVFARSKKGLLPFIELNGVQYADTAFIIEHLTKVFHKESLEAHMSQEQKAIARAFRQMTENSTVCRNYIEANIKASPKSAEIVNKIFFLALYRTYGYVRWVEKTKEFFSEEVAGPKSFVLKALGPINKRLYAHGYGRHSRDEIMSIGMDDLRALSSYLNNKPYFTGDTASHVDAAFFGLLAQILYIPVETPHQSLLINECQNLVQFCDRIKERYWPDWKEATSTLSLHTTWKKPNLSSEN